MQSDDPIAECAASFSEAMKDIYTGRIGCKMAHQPQTSP
jgi:hypothetical protein